MSLKSKLIITFCGPLTILVIVGLMSVRTVTLSSMDIERILRENYDSVAACIKMKDSLEHLDRIAEFAFWGVPEDPRQKSKSSIIKFEKNLKFQQGNVTVPGEQELTDRLTGLWKTYRSEFERFINSTSSEDARRDLYRTYLLPRSQEVRDTAQRVIDINLANMVSADGQARQRGVETTIRMIVLVASGVVLTIILIAVIGPSVVKPITQLTRSVREIQQGNLDLVVKVHSRDEVGELAAAFNEMAASLRKFRRTGRARLRRTQRAIQLALDTLSDAVAICSPIGEIELSNNVAQRLFGLKPESTVDAAGNEKIAELFTRVSQEQRSIHPKGYDGVIQIFQDGDEQFYIPRAVPIFDEDRSLIGITIVLTDVTSKRKNDEIKSDLISTVSHELKTPLTSIRLATHVLLNEKLGPLTSKQTEILSAARDDSDRLYHIIENLLDIGRIASGYSEVKLTQVNTEQTVLQAVEEMRSAYVDRGIALVLDIPGDIPPVLADSMRLESVFTNLLSNSLKNTSPGGQVTVSAQRDGSMVRFCVEDTGAGIPREYLPHIFEKFFRVPGREQQRNSGLGLAIVKEIIEAHGGKIDVTSEPGKGTQFVFTLRAAELIEPSTLI
ncbi:MAG: HAMP domain-containing protein [Deltaproteobacteria bacterium]|nr:HAMP domain-containing protein [Deltaproteobacteria bacterium]